MSSNKKKEKEKSSSSVTDSKQKEILIGDYILKHTIGKGTFSRVKLGINKNTGEKVAIKILDKTKIVEKEDLERIIREMKMLSELDNEHIIKVYQIYENERNYLIIMEYCSGGELFNYIVEKQRLSEDEASYFYYQLIQGVEYIHSKGIAHRDLKPENLLLDQNKKLKIIDFGLSNYFDGEKKLETPCGSPCYASPEMVGGNKYDGFLIDIWASGIILFAMLCGYLPFEDDNNDILFKQILGGKIEYPKYLSEISKDLMKKIIETNPKKRIIIDDIKKHPFFLNGKKIYEKKFKKMKVKSLKEIHYEHLLNNIKNEKEVDINILNINNSKKKEKNDLDIISKKYIQTEVNYKKKDILKEKEITLQNELIKKNKIGLLTKCLDNRNISHQNNKSNKPQIFFSTRTNNNKDANVEKILQYFNKSQFHFNTKNKKTLTNRHFKSNEKKINRDKKMTLQNIRKNFDIYYKQKDKINFIKENALKYNITDVNTNMNNNNNIKQINDNKSILINNAVINLNMFSDKTEINIDSKKQNTLKSKSPFVLRLYRNKKENFPTIKIINNENKSKNKYRNKIHLNTETNVLNEMNNNYKIRNINRTNNFFRIKLNTNLKFNNLYKNKFINS